MVLLFQVSNYCLLINMPSTSLESDLKLSDDLSEHLSYVLEVVNENPNRIGELITFVDNQLQPACPSSYWIANVDIEIEYEEFPNLDEMKSKWLQINQLERNADSSDEDNLNENEDGDDEEGEGEAEAEAQPYQMHSHSF